MCTKPCSGANRECGAAPAFGTTTHRDLLKRVGNATLDVPINDAVGCCGLQLYRLGETISIPWRHSKPPPKAWATLSWPLPCLARLKPSGSSPLC